MFPTNCAGRIARIRVGYHQRCVFEAAMMAAAPRVGRAAAYPGNDVCASKVKITNSRIRIPPQPRRRLPTAWRIRSAGIKATIAPTPNCHMRPNVTK